jgi:hypothetical protein
MMALHVYTAQREAYHGRDALDLTRATALSESFMSAGTRACRAQSTAMVAVRERYLTFLRLSYRSHRVRWETLLTRSRIVVLCSCAPGTLTCRRYVLAETLGKLGAVLCGEIRVTSSTRYDSARNGRGERAARRSIIRGVRKETL